MKVFVSNGCFSNLTDIIISFGMKIALQNSIIFNLTVFQFSRISFTRHLMVQSYTRIATQSLRNVLKMNEMNNLKKT